MASFLDRILSHGHKKKVLTQEQAARSVVVSNIAPQTADENVVIHFQKQRNGGGEIDHVHIPKEGTAVITFESSEVAKRVLGYSHVLEESKLKLHLFVPEEPREVFKQVKARFNFEMFDLSPQLSRDMLEDLKQNTEVAEVDSKDCNVFIVSGAFSQIKAAHERLQILINQNGRRGKEVINCGKNGAQTHQDASHCSDIVTSDTSTIAESNSFEVQPQFMKLLKRVYKSKLQEIEVNFCVQIVWDENTTQVRISPSKMSNRQNRFQDGCDAFIDLYQKFHPNMGREEVELPEGTDEARVIEAVSLAQDEDPVIIEKVDKNLVVYAEKNSIKSSVQSLKAKLGLTNDGSNKKTRRGQGNKLRDVLKENETSHQRLIKILDNGVKLSLYQGDITDERVDAIVNAANEWLKHGAGVAGAIIRKGGRQIQDESNRITNQYGPLDVGRTAYTSGGNLPCSYVIHTVGPRWKEHGREESISLLHRACVESLSRAAQLELSSIALTAISSGIFGMPKDICATVMFKAVEKFSSSDDAVFSTLRDVRIVIIDDSTISVFQEEFVKRYLSHKASSETVTTQTRPSDEHRATPPNPDSKLDVGKSKGYDLVDQTQSADTTPPDGQQEQNNNVDSSGITPFTDEENSGQHAVPDSLSNQDIEMKESLPTSVESPQIEGNEVSHEIKETYAAPVVNAVIKGDESADFKAFSRMGRGKGHFAPKFQFSSATSAGKGKSAPLNGSTIADSGTGRGMICNATSPPGLAVSEEGKNLAKSLGDRVTGDPKSNVDGSIIDKNDVEKNESSSDSLKDANNSNNDGENPGEYSLNGRPTDHRRSGNNLTPEEKMLDQDKTTEKSERPSSNGSRKRPPVEHTENDKPSHDQRKKDHTKSGKKVKEESEPVSHATEKTMSSQNPLTLTTTEGEVQTAIKNSAQDDSSTSCPHSSSDHPVSHQSGNKVDKENTRERRNVEDRTRQDSDSSPPPLSDMQFGHRKNEPNCLMCMNFNKDPLYLSKCGLDHYYCKSCTKHLLEKTGWCPQCDKEGLLQPTGNMTWITKKESLPGYEDCEVIAMFFTFYEGIQGPGHPNPGQPYSALHTSAFLPCNSDGKEVCCLLKRAFDSRLLFTIGTSPTTGEKNKIIWNGIELKTNQSGGPASYGYPDPSYLDRVKKQLAEKGITQLHG